MVKCYCFNKLCDGNCTGLAKVRIDKVRTVKVRQAKVRTDKVRAGHAGLPGQLGAPLGADARRHPRQAVARRAQVALAFPVDHGPEIEKARAGSWNLRVDELKVRRVGVQRVLCRERRRLARGRIRLDHGQIGERVVVEIAHDDRLRSRPGRDPVLGVEGAVCETLDS